MLLIANLKQLKKILFFVSMILFLSSCTETKPLKFEKQEIKIEDFFDCKSGDCIVTEIELIKCVDEDLELSKRINDEIEKSALMILMEDNIKSMKTLEEGLLSFNDFYKKNLEKSTEEIIPYGMTLDSKVTFQNEEILSIHMNFSMITGGRNGIKYGERYITLDRKTGKIIPVSSFFKEEDSFTEI